MSGRMAAVAAAVVLLLAAGSAWANNLVVTNVVVSARDTNTAFVAFDLSWENSWRDTNVNHDAAWVFFKVRQQGTTDWTNHVVLEGTGTNPAGYAVGTGTPIEMIVPTDKVGLFVRRSQQGAGNVSVAGVKAVWNIAASGMASTSIVEMTACAVEMVYVAEGSFEAGDGQSDQKQFTKTLINTGDPTVAPSGSPLAGGYPSGGGSYPAAAPSTTNWPNGYNAFYCMKHEITQGQYTDFLNMLTRAQQATCCIATNLNYYMSTNAGGSATVQYRNTVQLTTDPGSPNPRVYTTVTPDRACNYLSWADGCAFADWAGLRPMTDLEFEKACRGPTAAVAGEYAWGTNTSTAISGLQGTDGSGQEYYTAGNLHVLDNGGPSGPVRAGIFATATSSRQQAGASYWGIMELSGNVWERSVTIASAGGGFTGLHGDGNLDATGNANVTAWPGTGASGAGFRGGNWYDGATCARASDRFSAAYVDSGSEHRYGWRGVRAAPSGVGP